MERTGGQDFRRIFRDGLEDGVGKALDHLLDASNANVPVDDSDLRDSGKATHKGLSGVVSYDTEYAVKQHEDMSLRHENGGSAKFLENARNAESREIMEIIARTARSRL